MKEYSSMRSTTPGINGHGTLGDDRVSMPQTTYSNYGPGPPGPLTGPNYSSPSANKFIPKPTHPHSVLEHSLQKPNRPRPIDYNRLSESLRYAWNEREEKEFDKSLMDRKRIASEDEHHLSELRRIRFESTMADWEVLKVENQLQLMSRQLEEIDGELRGITRR
ncbi:hypothetical protein BC829DRAFT_404949 [Chytridium lagenaria]|nr:hypothetical protein BC829DRAFT_404949 [Chytridium lagenaria]